MTASTRQEHVLALVDAMPMMPGVYRMLAQDGSILYVGKARQLRSRVGSYFHQQVSSPKTRALVQRICDIQITVTASETEALLLEQTLIKTLSPPYNILLRDDKSYPYILMTEGEPYPRLTFHRGARKVRGRYFGPYPSASAVRDTLAILQRLFQVRQCENAFFRNRQRPCLQHQIGRCRAPCVAAISPEDYAADVRATQLFLEGRSHEVQEQLVARMQAAAETLDFERAAIYRDQIQTVRMIQEQQSVHKSSGQVDVVAVAARPGGVCLVVLCVRQGRVLGSRLFYPQAHGETSGPTLLADFLPQYYLNPERFSDLPDEVILEERCDGLEILADALHQASGHALVFRDRVRENRAAWLDLARLNAEQGLQARMANRLQQAHRIARLAELLGVDREITRLECFDISHSSGEATTASCVVFDAQGPSKKEYLHFNIEGVTAGDDYAAMHQALTRRYSGSQAKRALPDILFIDGGVGQLAQATSVMHVLELPQVLLVGIAKGEGRKPGLETLHLVDGRQIQLASDDRALHLIQQIRDEAHRFAVSGHRARRSRHRKDSVLLDIPGVGPVRRQQLLTHWGGMQELMRASLKELVTTPRISIKLAEQIYAALHGGPPGD
ncbi:MAG: excinuclease ABC subunit UvrC [Pseudomonadales bacterium]|nr:excinuclease ABC subunit UvrC [Pseudomonadales bacterium]